MLLIFHNSVYVITSQIYTNFNETKGAVTFLLCCLSSASSILLYVEFLLALLLFFCIFSSSLIFSLLSVSNSTLIVSSSLAPDFPPTFTASLSALSAICVSDLFPVSCTSDISVTPSLISSLSSPFSISMSAEKPKRIIDVADIKIMHEE
jgi:hypothetical protein